MKDIRKIGSRIEAGLASKGIGKYYYRLTEKETRELNAENGEFSLLRTLFDNNAAVSVYKGSKNGTVAGNDFSDAGIDALVDAAILSAESAVEDPAHDIAPKQKAEKFSQGVVEADFDLFFKKVQELLADIKAEYPKIQIQNIISKYISAHTLYRNSNGTDFEENDGLYSVTLEFAGHDGDKTTGLDYCGFLTASLEGKLIDQASVRYHLDSAQKQLELIPVNGKFTGKVIFTPECFAEFLSYSLSCYVDGTVILDGTSLWKDKIGQQVADSSLTVVLKSSDPRLVNAQRFTPDGFRTEDMPIIEKGILKNFLINLYIANKTGKPVSMNLSSDAIVEAGNESLASMIENVDRGLIVGGFSGGQPSTNGDFSGVAKNSYYIENGKVVGAISETMINGNLGDMLMNIKAISSETVEDGSMVVPYVCVDGIVISGK